MKAYFAQFIIATFTILLALSSKLNAQECSDVYSSLVFEDKTGKIISQTRSDQIIYPASLTKLMTVYIAFEKVKEGKLKMNQFLPVSDRAEEVASVNRITTLKLQKGDMISVSDAIEGAIIKSFNEATIVLAEAISGSEWKFARLMNKKAQELGMVHTNFRNPSGLHDRGHYTTSHDLARLVAALKRDFPQYYPIFSLKEFEFNNTKFTSHNFFLFDYEGAEGMKTGFTSKAGYNLIASALKDDDRLTSILVSCASSEGRNEFTKELLDDGFEKLAENKRASSLFENNDLLASSETALEQVK
ncbi:MAG: D-alanyl-D-alanine carboxypeptidase [Proteobacteria bacterium]|nr:D-alanyl-D-alanine carboxypeptidase [Pseudomonadota bacterium]